MKNRLKCIRMAALGDIPEYIDGGKKPDGELFEGDEEERDLMFKSNNNNKKKPMKVSRGAKIRNPYT